MQVYSQNFKFSTLWSSSTNEEWRKLKFYIHHYSVFQASDDKHLWIVLGDYISNAVTKSNKAFTLWEKKN